MMKKVAITQQQLPFFEEHRDSKGRLHRDDGPAVVYSTGAVEYWKHGKPIRKPPATEPNVHGVDYDDIGSVDCGMLCGLLGAWASRKLGKG